MNSLNSNQRKEFICNLIPDECIEIPKQKCYKSTHGYQNNSKSQHRTMGKAEEIKPDPKNYLKKHSNTNPTLEKSNKKFTYSCEIKKDKLPTKDDWIQLPSICHKQNIINRNAICATIQPPRQPDRIVVDTRKGEKFKLANTKTNSGLEKFFIYKDSYGKVPKYIRRRMKAVANTQEAYENYMNEKFVNNSNYYLTQEQRADIIIGLKRAWDKFNQNYLKLSYSSDTIKFLKYKKYLESEMASLEKDIQLLEGHKFIFIEPALI